MGRVGKNKAKCLCPYCLQKFRCADIMFRIPKTFSNTAIEQEKKQRTERNPDNVGYIRAIENYRRKADPKLEQFWKKYGKKSMGKNCRVPAVGIEEAKSFRARIEYDKRNLPYQLRDINNDVSTMRVCPNCHNDLPPEYGRGRIRHIAVMWIGNAECGVGEKGGINNPYKKICTAIGANSSWEKVEAVRTSEITSGKADETPDKGTYISPDIWILKKAGSVEKTLVLREFYLDENGSGMEKEYWKRCLKTTDGAVLFWNGDDIKMSGSTNPDKVRTMETGVDCIAAGKKSCLKRLRYRLAVEIFLEADPGQYPYINANKTPYKNKEWRERISIWLKKMRCVDKETREVLNGLEITEVKALVDKVLFVTGRRVRIAYAKLEEREFEKEVQKLISRFD